MFNPSSRNAEYGGLPPVSQEQPFPFHQDGTIYKACEDGGFTHTSQEQMLLPCQYQEQPLLFHQDQDQPLRFHPYQEQPLFLHQTISSYSLCGYTFHTIQN